MGETGKPTPQVKDADEGQEVYDWSVPLTVGDREATIDGTLFWTPEESGFPVAAAGDLGVVAVLGLLVVLVVRRRRGPTERTAEDAW